MIKNMSARAAKFLDDFRPDRRLDQEVDLREQKFSDSLEGTAKEAIVNFSSQANEIVCSGSPTARQMTNTVQLSGCRSTELPRTTPRPHPTNCPD